METPSALFTYQFALLLGSIATGPPSPPRICGHGPIGGVVLSFTPAVPFTPSPAIMV